MGYCSVVGFLVPSISMVIENSMIKLVAVVYTGNFLRLLVEAKRFFLKLLLDIVFARQLFLLLLTI